MAAAKPTHPTPAPPEPPAIFTVTTLLSLSSVLLILLLTYALSLRLLPRAASSKTRALFIWHLFDALVHLTLEASYLYHAFFTSTTPTATPPHLTFTPAGTNFLSDPTRLHGAQYSTSPTARLWREYALADARWGGADPTIISLELVTVFVMAPLSLHVCQLLRGADADAARAWFWMVVVATGELYGGFMTFAPEWLCGSPNLDTGNWMHLWVYLFFFNTLWVWVPLWVLWEAWRAVGAGSAGEVGGNGGKGVRKRG